MSSEIELRARIGQFKEIKKTLRNISSDYSDNLLIKDYAFDRKGGYFRKRGVMIRLRSVGDQKHLFAYKGPHQDGSYKVREEIELEISDPKKLIKILNRVGLSITFEMEKKRQTFYLENTKVELDHYPCLGRFVEVEGKPSDIEKVIKKLDMDREQFNNKPLDYYINQKKKEIGEGFLIKF